MRQKRKNKIIIFSLLGVFCLMTAGYAAFQTNLDIKGTSKVSSNWDIRITNVRAGTITGDAEQAKQPIWNELTASVEANLYQKGDSIEYIITVENKGTIDAILNSINTKETTNEAIKFTYSGVNKNDKLYKGESTEIIVRIEYNPDFNGNPEIGSAEINITLEYIQAIVGGIEIINPNLYVSSKGNDETGKGTKEKPYKTIKKAYEEAKEEGTIYIMDDITQNETINFNENKNITLTSYGIRHSIIRGDNLTEVLLKATEGTLNLENVILDGNNIEVQSALLVSEKNLITNTGTIIQNNKNIYVPSSNVDYKRVGGGICVYSGTALIENTKILNNSMSGSDSGGGGGIYTYYDTELTVNNSVISNNHVSRFGAGIAANADVIIKSSEISNNTAARSGGGISHGIGTLKIMEGTKINNNTAASYGGGIVAMDNSNLLIENATISNNTTDQGGGIRLIGTSTQKIKLEISGNTLIDGNQAENYGGGIRATHSDIIIKGGTISNNSTNREYYPSDKGNHGDGGAINLDNSTLNMSGGLITKNQGRNGFGIAVFSNSSFTMTGGTISENTGDRGVITLYNKGQFILNGGTIKNNKATYMEGGISVDNSLATNKYTYKSGIVCGNTLTNSYETQTTCPTS